MSSNVEVNECQNTRQKIFVLCEFTTWKFHCILPASSFRYSTYEADACKYTLISAMKKEVFFVKIVSASPSVNIIRRIHTPSLVYQQYLLDLKQHVFHSSESNYKHNAKQVKIFSTTEAQTPVYSAIQFGVNQDRSPLRA